MPARVWKLKNFTCLNRKLDVLYAVTDENLGPILLPLFYSIHLSLHGTVFEIEETSESHTGARSSTLKERKIADTTARSYVYCLASFLTHLEKSSDRYPSPGMHSSSKCEELRINNYLNSELAKTVESAQSLEVHRSALGAYFNWLTYIGECPVINLKIYRKTRQKMAEKSSKPTYIQYVTRENRAKLINACSTLGEKLILRMGFEVGLRAAEVAGMRTSGKGGIEELFQKLNDPNFDHHLRFPYYLEGRYAKRGTSRWIYFDRELLRDMYRYYCTERRYLQKESKNSPRFLFLRSDNRFRGTPIGSEQASRVFRKVSPQAGLNPALSFHDLRHTFATELFQEELRCNSGRETRSESAALIVVAQRLGHKFTRSGQAPPTTTRYIRMRIQMSQLEDWRR